MRRSGSFCRTVIDSATCARLRRSNIADAVMMAFWPAIRAFIPGTVNGYNKDRGRIAVFPSEQGAAS